MPTHSELVERAIRWLHTTRRCEVTAAEPKRWNMLQSPDAIGWQGTGWSIAVECKTTLSDLRAQRHKTYRKHGELHIGQERWLLVPKGLITAEWWRQWDGGGAALGGQSPFDGWGVLELRKTRVYRVVDARKPDDFDPSIYRYEAPFLVQAARMNRGERRRLDALSERADHYARVNRQLAEYIAELECKTERLDRLRRIQELKRGQIGESGDGVPARETAGSAT